MSKLRKQVEEGLKEKYAPKAKKRNPNNNPSALTSPCRRKIYYSFNKVEPDYPFSLKDIVRFEEGETVHKMVQDWLRKHASYIDYRDPKTGEIPPNYFTGEPDPEFPVTSWELGIKMAKIDGVAVIDDKVWIYEIKSINDKGFGWVKKTGPKERHLEQAMTYAYLLEKSLAAGKFRHIPELEGFSEVEGVIMIYVNREHEDGINLSDYWLEYQRKKDDEMFSQTLSKIVDLKKHLKKEKLPPKTEDFCSNCQFRDKCRKNYNPKPPENWRKHLQL